MNRKTTIALSITLLLFSAIALLAEVTRDRVHFAFGMTTKCTPDMNCEGDVVTVTKYTPTSYRVACINKGWSCTATNGVMYRYLRKDVTYGLWNDPQVNRIVTQLIEGTDGTGWWIRSKDVITKKGKHIQRFDEGCLP